MRKKAKNMRKKANFSRKNAQECARIFWGPHESVFGFLANSCSNKVLVQTVCHAYIYSSSLRSNTSMFFFGECFLRFTLDRPVPPTLVLNHIYIEFFQ